MDADNDKTIIRPRPGARRSAADPDRTIVRPRPGGAAASAGDATIVRPRRGPALGGLSLAEAPGFGRSPLLDAAGGLLWLASQVNQVQTQVDVAQLHRLAVERVRAFQDAVAVASLAPGTAEQASYLLCALVDESVLNTHWGEHSVWSQKTLLRLFHQEASGGERVFSMIDEALSASRKNHDLLELAFLCLSLGFEGKYRMDPRGRDRIEQIREDLYRVLQEARDRYRRELATPAAPARSVRHRLQSFLSVWVTAAVLGLSAFALFSYLLFELNTRSDAVLNELAALVPPPEEPLELAASRAETEALRGMLAPELERGVLTLEEYPSKVSLVLSAESLFAPGSATIAEPYVPVLEKVARALEGLAGRVVVSGHTDDRPIRTPRFPSNWHLSLARASEVVRHMSAAGGLSGRLLPEGRADAEPVADNATPEGRALNRRVVIELFYGGGRG